MKQVLFPFVWLWERICFIFFYLFVRKYVVQLEARINLLNNSLCDKTSNIQKNIREEIRELELNLRAMSQDLSKAGSDQKYHNEAFRKMMEAQKEFNLNIARSNNDLTLKIAGIKNQLIDMAGVTITSSNQLDNDFRQEDISKNIKVILVRAHPEQNCVTVEFVKTDSEGKELPGSDIGMVKVPIPRRLDPEDHSNNPRLCWTEPEILEHWKDYLIKHPKVSFKLPS